MSARNPRWQREHEQRMLAVRTCVAGGCRPEVVAMVAAGHGVKPATVRTWIRRSRQGQLAPRAPGRKATKLPFEQRRSVVLSLFLLGPYAGEGVLRGRHPKVPYRALRQLKAHVGRLVRRRQQEGRDRLAWHGPGRVWAMDFTEPKASLARPMKRLFLVRDLASGKQLAAIPVTGETTLAVWTTLAALFEEYGAPLVLKCDNARAFRAPRVRALLAEHGVQPMFSPVRRPEYNGSCERAGGHIKARIENVATLNGRPGCWNLTDIGEACWQANHTARPWGARGPTPARKFGRRRPIHARERRRFQQTRTLLFEQALLRYKEEHGNDVPRPKEATWERRATRDALRELGYLTIREGRVSTHLSARKGASIA